LRYIIQSTNENAVLQKSFISQSELHYVQYAGLEIFQEQAHFSASSVPHLRHLRHVPVKCLILRHLFKSVNENAVLKIVQDGLHFGSSQAAHLSCLSCCNEKQLTLSCLEKAGLKIVQDGLHFSGSQAAQLSRLSHLVKKRLILSHFKKKLRRKNQ
jgi:hypothetical protein